MGKRENTAHVQSTIAKAVSKHSLGSFDPDNLTRMPIEFIKPRSWMTRNWYWFVLGFLVVGAVIAVPCFFLLKANNNDQSARIDQLVADMQQMRNRYARQQVDLHRQRA